VIYFSLQETSHNYAVTHIDYINSDTSLLIYATFSAFELLTCGTVCPPNTDFSGLDKFNKSVSNIRMDDIIDILPKLKKNKAAGPDGIAAEAFLFGTPKLFAHLFSWFLRFGYLPGKFVQSTIIPLVKNKCGDLSEVDNYRVIMISNAITKVLEFVLYDTLVKKLPIDDYQFGF